MQAFIFTKAESSPDRPRVQKVYDCFSCGEFYYLVMERIELPTVEGWIDASASETELLYRQDEACRAVAKALTWLFTLPAPEGAEVGHIEGAYAQTLPADVRAQSGRSRYPFFGYCHARAPYRYTDVSALQEHINEALKRRPARNAPLAVDFSGERLVMVQGGIRSCSFLIDPNTLQITVTDFGRVSALPQSFVNFTVHSSRDRFLRGINKCLPWERTDNVSAMGEAAHIYILISEPRFGLDKDGRTLKKVRSKVTPR